MKNLSEFAHGVLAPANAAQSVLVVDDEKAVRRFAARVLEQGGFGVLQASDGAEALEVLKGPGQFVDAVVSDILMPRVNGVELMRELSVSHPSLPVILMSGYADQELSAQGIKVPCSMVAKPFPPEVLLAEVRRCVRRRDGGTSAA
jgi:two-component system cell cycle sensor histidine kinase/response regulator CckA